MPAPAPPDGFNSYPNFKQALDAVRRKRKVLFAGRSRGQKAVPTAVQLRAALSLLGRPAFPD